MPEVSHVTSHEDDIDYQDFSYWAICSYSKNILKIYHEDSGYQYRFKSAILSLISWNINNLFCSKQQ